MKPLANQPPMVAFGNIKNKIPYEMLETRRFVARHKLDAFTFNPHFPVNTLQLMRGAGERRLGLMRAPLGRVP